MCRESRWNGDSWEERGWRGFGVVIGVLIVVSAAGPDEKHWPVIVEDAFVSLFCSGVVVEERRVECPEAWGVEDLKEVSEPTLFIPGGPCTR